MFICNTQPSMPIVGVPPNTGTPALVVAPKDTNEEDAVHLVLQESLSYGIRAIRASFGLRSKVYRAILDVICYGTRTPARATIWPSLRPLYNCRSSAICISYAWTGP